MYDEVAERANSEGGDVNSLTFHIHNIWRKKILV